MNLVLLSAKSCPYAHRIEMVINLKGLQNEIDVVWCDPAFKFSEWVLDYEYKGKNPKTLFSCDKLSEIYEKSNHTGRASLPILYDLNSDKIVCNESADIIKMLNGMENTMDLYPENLRNDIDAFCTEFNQRICVDTYKAGHAKTYDEYKLLFDCVFDYLEQLNKKLTSSCVLGNSITLADVHVFAHLIRFDCVFYSLFSLNKRHLWEYQNIAKYMERMSVIKEVSSTVDLEEIKRGAYMSENNQPQNMGCLKVPLGNGGMEYYFCLDK